MLGISENIVTVCERAKLWYHLNINILVVFFSD